MHPKPSSTNQTHGYLKQTLASSVLHQNIFCTQHKAIDERLQWVKPLRYPPIRGKLSFSGVVSVTLSFHPQGRNVNDVTNEAATM